MMARKMFMQQPRATLNKHPGLGRRLCICWKHINKRPLAILDKIDGKLIRSVKGTDRLLSPRGGRYNSLRGLILGDQY